MSHTWQLGAVSGVTDNTLISAYLEGNERAFQVLVSRYQSKLVNFINLSVRDYELAVDLAQETFIRVYRNAAHYEGKYQFSTWIYRIATNLIIDEMRRRQRKGRVFLNNVLGLFQQDEKTYPLPDVRQTPDRTLSQKESVARLETAVLSLPEKYRFPFILKEVQELSYEEVAEVLNLSRGTVKSRTHRAKLLLREKLAGVL